MCTVSHNTCLSLCYNVAMKTISTSSDVSYTCTCTVYVARVITVLHAHVYISYSVTFPASLYI